MISIACYVTPNAVKYMQQLAKHFTHKIDVRSDERSADFALQAGKVRLDADDSALVVRIEAEDAKSLIDARHVIDKHLVIFAFREGFAGLNWRIADGAKGLPPTIDAYARAAAAALPSGIAAYVMGGAGDEVTLRRNEVAFDALPILPRVLRDVDGCDTTLDLLGTRLDHPILIAPVAWQRLVHPDAERATAAGATAQGARMVLSAQATIPLAEARAAGGLCDWFQLLWVGREATLALAQRAADAGYTALMLTVDAPVTGLRPRETRTGFTLPAGLSAVNLAGLPMPRSRTLSDFLVAAPIWADVEWLCTASPLPVLFKGILHSADACRAVEAGAAGVVVSNHGGRVLDGLPASVEVLPAVTAAVARRVPVLIDGGIRRGIDVLRARALGADAVMVGRPVACGLAAAGAMGVAHVIRLLREELRIAMALTGCASLADVGPGLIFGQKQGNGGLTQAI